MPKREIDRPDPTVTDSPAAILTPDWVKHAVFYQIFPDRFAKSETLDKPHNLEAWDSDPTPFGYKGGDLVGVRERLDYLQDLGITALYFNPIFQSASNHRYHTHDYYQVDPLLGGDEAFDVLVAECRRRDVHIVLDGVFSSIGSPFASAPPTPMTTVDRLAMRPGAGCTRCPSSIPTTRRSASI